MLDMGEPVRIVELARAMIELSGLDPDRDIDDRDRRPPPRREAPRGAVQQLRARPADRRREDPAAPSATPLAADAVEAMFDEIGLLVLEGDAAGLAAKVSELSARDRRERDGVRRARPAYELGRDPT